MPTKPSDAYRWATNAGTRVEPPDTLKASGAVPGQALGSGAFNDVLGRLTDLAVWLEAILPGSWLPALRARVAFAAADPDEPGITRTEIVTDSDLLFADVCPLSDAHLASGLPRLLVGWAEDTTPAVKVATVNLLTRAVGSPVTVASGTAGNAGIALVHEPGTQNVWCYYHIGDTIRRKKSTDSGATWGSEVEVWDPTDADASNVFPAPAAGGGRMSVIRLHTGDNAGRHIVVADYWDDDASSRAIRYVYSDDGDTYETNGGSGWPIFESSILCGRPKTYQDTDGVIWTFAGRINDGDTWDLWYQRSTGTGLPDPPDPNDPSIANVEASIVHYPVAIVPDPSGALLHLGEGASPYVVRAFGVVPDSNGLRVIGATPQWAYTGAGQLPGGGCVGPDGGFYVVDVQDTGSSYTTTLYEFDVSRQFVPTET